MDDDLNAIVLSLLLPMLVDSCFYVPMLVLVLVLGPAVGEKVD